MATKVSIASSSAARAASTHASTHASESSASREPSGASTSNRFSSLMGAASQPEASSEQKPSSPAHSTDAAASTGQSNHSAATARAAGKGQTHGQGSKSTAAAGADAATAGAAGTAGASTTNSSASSIDGDTQDQDSEKLDKNKLRSEQLAAAGAIPADPSALTLLLSSPGSPVDGSNTSDTKSNGDGDSKSAEESLQNAAAAGALAVGMIMGSAGGAGPMPNFKVNGAGPQDDTGAVGSATTVSVQSASQSSDQSLIKLDALAAGLTSNDGSLSLPSDLSLQPPSADSQSSQLAALAGSAGSESIVRNAGAATAQSTGTINLPVGDRNWPGAVAGHLQWMVSNNIQSATLQLSPEHLGPVEVRIEVHQSQVNVSFSADHPETRSALEQSVPTLRAIFAGGGLTLGQATVQQESRSASQFSQPSARGSLITPMNADSVALPSIRAPGLVDEYA
jgi:flagellar hook-length control protein FliK